MVADSMICAIDTTPPAEGSVRDVCLSGTVVALYFRLIKTESTLKLEL